MHGWLLLDKPEDTSSTQTLNKLKKFVKPYKIGHAGTLDPFASGLLVIAIGEATKLVSYAMKGEKSYTFTIKWGEDKDTLDRCGSTTATSSSVIDPALIHTFIKKNCGVIKQVPPNYSAIHINGQRAYSLARQGKIFEMPSREVLLKQLFLSQHTSNRSEFVLKCGKGFYVRALARDIAHSMEVCGHVETLCRTKVGKFHLDNALTLDYLLKLLHNTDNNNCLKSFLQPVHSVLDDILVQFVSPADAHKLRCGQEVPSSLVAKGNDLEVAVYAQDTNQLLGMCVVEGDYLQPKKMLNIT